MIMETFTTGLAWDQVVLAVMQAPAAAGFQAVALARLLIPAVVVEVLSIRILP